MQLTHVGTLQSMAPFAWVEDVKLARPTLPRGQQVCWSFHVLRAMLGLRLLQAEWRWQPVDCVLAMQWEESAGSSVRLLVFHVDGMVDPRQAPSQGVSMCTHHTWLFP
jgi:hypothetical protein